MKALIFNSGTGSRMGELTRNKPKCLVEISEGITILDRQIRCLIASGIHVFVITTGQYDDMIKSAIANKNYSAEFVFVNNPLYDKTNYIYSMYLAQEHLDSDLILLHGDMVFEEKVLQDLIIADDESLVIVNKSSYLSEKDFNASVKDGIITRICVGDKKADHFLLPIYKLKKETLKVWLGAVNKFVADNKTTVYAEDAFNCIADKVRLRPFFIDISCDFCMEIDNNEDLDICREMDRG